MILPALPQTASPPMSGTSHAKNRPEDGAFGVFWATELPTEDWASAPENPPIEDQAEGSGAEIEVDGAIVCPVEMATPDGTVNLQNANSEDGQKLAIKNGAPPAAASILTVAATQSAETTVAVEDIDNVTPPFRSPPEPANASSTQAAAVSQFSVPPAVSKAGQVSGSAPRRDTDRSPPVTDPAQPEYPAAKTQATPINPPQPVPTGTAAQLLSLTAPNVFEKILTSQDAVDADETGLLPLQSASNAGPMAATSLHAYQLRQAPLPLSRQLTEAFVRSEGGRTEIALNPEELGRVRFAMVTSDAGMTLAITTERPETADLIRRNLDDLAREFRQMGFENLTFSFNDAPRHGAFPASQFGGSAENIADDATAIAVPVLLKRLRTGLDLKL